MRGPHKRLTFAAHAAVARFPIFSVPVLGGPAFSRSQFKKRKRDPRRLRFFVFVHPIGDWCWVGGIDRAFVREAYLCQKTRIPRAAGPFFLNRALGMRGPQQRNAKMGKRETTAWEEKASRLGEPKGESGDAITGM